MSDVVDYTEVPYLQEILNYLPIDPADEEDVINYIQNITNLIAVNYKYGQYQFAYFGLHLLYMTFIYCTAWKIGQIEPERYKDAIVFARPYSGRERDFNIEEAESIFAYSLMPEKEIAKLFTVIELDKSQISTVSNLVDTRNEMAHASGKFDILTEEIFEAKANSILNSMKNIHKCMDKPIRKWYGQVLLSFCKGEFDGYDDPKDVNFIVKGEQNTNLVPTSRSLENGIQEVGKIDIKKSENQTSANPKNRLLEVRNSDSNNIDINNTDMSHTYDQSINLPRTDFQNFSPGADGLIDGIDRNAVEEAVKKQIDYDCLMSYEDDSVVKMVEEIKDFMVDVLCGERTVISEGKRVSEETAKAAYRKITFEHVQYVLHSLVNYPDKISRIDRFLTTSLLNSVYTLMNSTFAGFEHDMGMKLL